MTPVKDAVWASSADPTMCNHTPYSLPLTFLYKHNDPGNILIEPPLLDSMICQLSQDRAVEQGGFLGIDSRGIIAGFCHDRDALRDETSYTPDCTCLATVMDQWEKAGLSFAGIIHTHAVLPRLSRSDLVYTMRLLECNPGMERILMGLLAAGSLTFYLFERDFIPWLNKKLAQNKPIFHT